MIDTREYWEDRYQKGGRAAAGSIRRVKDDRVTQDAEIERLAEEYEKYLKKYVSKVDVIVDYGCGSGRFLKMLSGFSKTVVGLDVSITALDIAMANCERDRLVAVDFRQIFGNAIELPDDSVDCICAITVFLHIPDEDLVQTLAEMRRVLRKDGILFVCDTTIENQATIDGFIESGVSRPHMFYRTKEQLIDLVPLSLVFQEREKYVFKKGGAES